MHYFELVYNIKYKNVCDCNVTQHENLHWAVVLFQDTVKASPITRDLLNRL